MSYIIQELTFSQKLSPEKKERRGKKDLTARVHGGKGKRKRFLNLSLTDMSVSALAFFLSLAFAYVLLRAQMHV